MIKVGKHILYKSVTRPYPPLVFSLFNFGFSRGTIWKTMLPVRFAISSILIINADVYYLNDYLYDLPKRVTTKMFANEKVFLDIKDKTLLAEKEFVAAKKKDYKEFFNALLRYVPALGIYHICDDFIEAKVKKALLRKTTLQEVEQLMHIINIPLEDNFSNKMNLELLKNGEKNINSFIQKYSWVVSRYGKYRLYTEKQVLEMLAHLKADNFLQKYLTQKKEIKKAINRAKELLGDKKYYVDIMQFFIYYRTQRTDIFNKHIFEYHDQLKALANSFGLNYQQLLSCTYPEILSQQIPDKKILNERSKNFILVGASAEEKLITGQEMKNFLKRHPDHNESRGIIRGRVAYPGKISGSVVLVGNAHDFKKVTVNSILVTNMTTPNMLQAMRRSKAIVTDEGGITCHAAILAREIKKPCVIGTKIATKVLKDGDMVEVDADQGKITIK